MFAQQVGGADDAGNNFRRDRNISVRQRPHPGYEALGLRTGAFMVWPKLSVTLERNDNIFATATDTQDDTIWHVQPEVNVISNWSRHELSAYARAMVHRFADFETENTEDYFLGAQGRLDVLRDARVTAAADWSRLTEPRTSSSSPLASVEPIRFEVLSASITGVRDFNRLRLSGRVDWRDFDYQNGATASGAPVLQGDRDRRLTVVTGRADYAISPDAALFVQAAGNRRAYRLDNPPAGLYPGFVDRDSEGVEVLAGANFDITALSRGEIGVGYIHQTFDSPAFDDISGFGARGQVEWFPTQLMTVTFTGSRTVEDSGIVGASSYVSTNVGAQLDYELLRNVILTGQANWGDDDYKGIDRQDERRSLAASATYLMNRRVGVTVGYTHFKQTSSGAQAGFDFDVNRVAATLTVQY